MNKMNSSAVSTILMFVVLIGLMYFMMIRPQKKQQQKRQDMLSNMKKGDEVITLGRLHGVIDTINTEDHTITLDCDGIFLTFEQSAIAQIVSQTPKSTTTVSKESAVEKPVEKSVDEKSDKEDKNND
ncbi:hypothetical protein FC89_GL000632 [Liquorilactobacillus ghanensis DSM 18630]|uniref:Preprotein translocase subunit YajC n=2 Tax=Liquorilactobacillus ghanensis TaxID=399370 RepID=A0A0R1VUS4_9LACO|nr:hypothetical protein FC89_GL000632 [Liquorilactobacillus ghanensis DSM 18630]